jgi:hypothetical protein
MKQDVTVKVTENMAIEFVNLGIEMKQGQKSTVSSIMIELDNVAYGWLWKCF